MKYKLILMFIFSFLVHITIAGALVYVPYQVSVHDQEDLGGEVIWGRIQGREGGRQKTEGRSKKQEARSKKQEARSQKQEVRSRKSEQGPPPLDPLPQGEGKIEMQEQRENPPLSPFFKGGTHVFPPLEKGGEGGIEGLSSIDLNANTGNGDGVLFALSTGGQSHIDEGDEIKNAEKGRIYNEQLKALIEQVKKEIEKNKYYPFIAKLKGIEGTVYVNFHIGQGGKPGSVAIMKSSGSKVLDEAAVRTIMNLKPFSNINHELRELDVSVPISYRLREE